MDSRTININGRDLAANIVLMSVFVTFSYAHFIKFQQTHELYLILIIVAESIIAVMAYVRRSGKTVSEHTMDWVVALAGTFFPLALRPQGIEISSILGNGLILTGVTMQIASILALNRSFGLVPANRGVQTQGMYRFVRHPLYLSYVFTFTGYLSLNLSLINLAVYLIWFFLMLFRIINEERHLLMDEDYLDYSKMVKWRLVPRLF